jgi:hypothetical protein
MRSQGQIYHQERPCLQHKHCLVMVKFHIAYICELLSYLNLFFLSLTIDDFDLITISNLCWIMKHHLTLGSTSYSPTTSAATYKARGWVGWDTLIWNQNVLCESLLPWLNVAWVHGMGKVKSWRDEWTFCSRFRIAPWRVFVKIGTQTARNVTNLSFRVAFFTCVQVILSRNRAAVSVL